MVDWSFSPSQCPRCLKRNQTGARFCTRCGLALAPTLGLPMAQVVPQRRRPLPVQARHSSSPRWPLLYLLVVGVFFWSRVTHVPTAQVPNPPMPTLQHLKVPYYYPPMQFPPPQEQPHAPGHNIPH